MTWLTLATPLLSQVGSVVHVAAGTNQLHPAGRGALAGLGHSPYGAVLWAVGRGLPDEVVARAAYDDGGLDRETEAVLSWASGPEAELLVATGIADREWLVVTGTTGALEVRPLPWSGAGGQLLLSDGRDTRRIDFAPGEPSRFADEHDISSVLEAVRRSAADGGHPVRPV